MFFKNLFLLFFFFVAVQQVNAQRAMYVTLAKQTVWGATNAGDVWTSNIFDESGTVPNELIDMLEYARDNNVTYLIFYKVKEVLQANHAQGLANFMTLAKSNNYCISKIGVNVSEGGIIGYPQYNSNGQPNIDYITPFNNNPNNPKFDALVSEYEFWTVGGNSFDNHYIPLLDKMNNMKQFSGHVLAVQGINNVDVYLNGKSDTDIFTKINIQNPSNTFTPNQNANRVDNRADNVFITCYKYYDGPLDLYDSYSKFKKTALILGNTGEIATLLDPKTASKSGTKIFPLLGVNNSLDQNGDFTLNYTNGYFELDPTISINNTPAEIEAELFNDINTEANIAERTIIQSQVEKDRLAWFKYEFLPKPTNYTGHYDYTNDVYTSNNILFSNNPTIVCNTSVIFDYSGPNEDGITYLWNFGDGTFPANASGTTSSSDQLASSDSRIHTYAEEGPYTVSLTLNYPSGCSYTYSKEINIAFPPLPTLSFVTSPVSGCDATNGFATVTLDNETIESCVWTTTEGQSFNSPTGQSSSTINNLSSNTYFVTINTVDGCEVSGSVGIPNNMAVSVANGFQINTNTLWNTPKNLKGVIKINSGATLTIDGTTVEFAYDVITLNDEGNELVGARFQVEDGGTLIIKNGAKLTACGNGVWDGIETRGPNAKVIINTGATIENAKIAIVNNQRTNLQSTSNRGTIEANNAKFVNNRMAIEVVRGTPATTFKDCQFIYDGNSRFTYPGFVNNGEYNPKQMTFVHLRESTGNGVKFQGNTFSTDVAAYLTDAQRGRGIQSEYASFTLRDLGGAGPGGNVFLGLGRGVYMIRNLSSNIVVIEGNSFIGNHYGITTMASTNTTISNNLFSHIPGSDAAFNYPYGVFMVGSTGFSVIGNRFSGGGGIYGTGSQGLAFEKTSQSGSSLQNSFKQLTCGIHTQDNNLGLKIQCNAFSVDGYDHDGALYVSGLLRNQGLADCVNPGQHLKAAGNVWYGPSANIGNSIRSFAYSPFNYYANETVGTPELYISNVVLPYPSLTGNGSINVSNLCAANGVNFDINSCISNDLYPLAPSGPGKVEDVLFTISTFKEKLTGHKAHFDFLKLQQELNLDSNYNNENNYDSLIQNEIESILFYSNEIQLLENNLIQSYIAQDKMDTLEQMLLNSGSSESFKFLANLYYEIGEFSKCRELLKEVEKKTNEEVYYLDEVNLKAKERENYYFIQFLNLKLDLAEQEIDFFKADQKQLTVLQEIAEANVQISIKAEWDLSLITGKEYEHFIVKEEMNSEKKMIVSNEVNQDDNKSSLTLYPNPTSGKLNVDFEINEVRNSKFIQIFDVMGKLLKTIRLEANSQRRLEIDCSEFANGIYSCVLISGGKVLTSKKLVIVK